MQLAIYTSIADINADDWVSWFGNDYPFLRYDFLLGLEQTGCTGGDSGWQPCHFVLEEEGHTIAVAPAFLKSHSYGEYVFDWSWADAWQRNGFDYYPKLVTAAPFTPATGPRLYLDGADPHALEKLLAGIREWSIEQGISGWNALFVEAPLSSALVELGLHQRQTVQFHWFNRDFTSFEDFLDTFSSRKRKNLKKERARVAAQGLTLETKTGSNISAEEWQFFHRCYQLTYAKRSGHGGYLNRAFFTELCPQLGEATVMVIAYEAQEPVAAALYFRSGDTLYGRYWGCLQEYEYLHFEACYYRGIEFAIAQGLTRFDPGAQGEHKIQRGFEPILTCSNHWIAAPQFDAAVGNFAAQERQQVRAYQQQAATLLPFKRGED